MGRTHVALASPFAWPCDDSPCAISSPGLRNPHSQGEFLLSLFPGSRPFGRWQWMIDMARHVPVHANPVTPRLYRDVGLRLTASELERSC